MNRRTDLQASSIYAVPENEIIRAGHLAARLLAVTLPMGLTLDEVLIEADHLQAQTHPFQAAMTSPGSLEVRVSDLSLAEFLNKNAPAGLSDFSVELKEGLVYVQARASVIISISVGAVCKLRIQDGTKLFVDLVRVDAIGGGGIHNIVQRQLDAINPVVDTAQLPLDANLTELEVDHKWVVVKGTAMLRP